MELSEDQLQSAILEAIEKTDTSELLKIKASTEGISITAQKCREFLKAGSRVLVEQATKRKPVPRKWVEAQAKRQSMQCADCERELRLESIFSGRDDYAEWDHSIALVQGGEHSRRNGRVVCRSCNSRKGGADSLQYSKHTGHLMTKLTVETEPESAT